LTNAFAEKIEKLVEQSREYIEVEREEVDQVPQSLNHCCRKPHTHIFVRAEARDVGTGAKDSEDGEEDLLANRVPELGRERFSVLLERVE
jgi:hypothetical protein